MHAADGRNLVFHEFAHQLDMLDGEAGGMPPLPNRTSERRWHVVIAEEFSRLGDDADHGRVTLLDQYGATNEAEFFADSEARDKNLFTRELQRIVAERITLSV